MKVQKLDLEEVLLILKDIVPSQSDKDLPLRVAEDFTKQANKLFAEKEAARKSRGEKLKYVPFPIATTGDPGLIWVLARQETLTQEEATLALMRVHDDFWASKRGLKLLQKRVEKTLTDFLLRVSAAALRERGLKRHYKDPEALKQVEAAKFTGKVTDQYKA